MNEIPLNCLSNCDAACCRDVSLRLSDGEVQRLKEAGGNIARLNVALDTHGRGVYKIFGDCPLLDGNQCREHGKINQPDACKSNLAGGEFCTGRRFIRDDRVKIWFIDEDGQKW